MKNSLRRKSQKKVSSSLKQRTRIKARKDFKGRGITPKVGQWYINKDQLAEKISKYVFAYRVTAVRERTERNNSIRRYALAERIERILKGRMEVEVLHNCDFLMLPAKVFKPVNEATIAAYLL